MTRVLLIAFLVNIGLMIYVWIKTSEMNFRTERNKVILYVLGFLAPLITLLFLYILRDEKTNGGRDEFQSR